MSSHRTQPWRRRALRLRQPEPPPPSSSSIETFRVQNPRMSISFHFCFVTLVFLAAGTASARAFFLFPPEWRRSEQQASAAHRSCQRRGLRVLPDQSEACLSGWIALKMFSTAGQSSGCFCLSHCCQFKTQRKRLFIFLGTIWKVRAGGRGTHQIRNSSLLQRFDFRGISLVWVFTNCSVWKRM